MKLHKTTTMLITGLALACAQGCSSQQTVEAENQAPTVQDTKTVENYNAPYQKPGAAVTFTHTYKGHTELGVTDTFQVVMSERYESGTMSVSIRADEGLDVSADTLQAEFPMENSDNQVIDISVSAQASGKYYVNLLATVDDGTGQTMRRNYAIAIIVGDASAKPSPASGIEETESGEKIIIMPAQETIKD